MTDPETTENDFAQFEASIDAPAPKTDDTPAQEETPPVDDQEPEDPEGNDETNDEDKDDKRRRSKPPAQRISEITAARRQAERERDDALERLAAFEAGNKPTGKPADLTEPNPDEFEFGEADPQYLRALARYEVKAEMAEEARKAEASRAEASQREQAATLDRSWEEKASKAVEKYSDFNEVVVEGAANGDWAAPPLVAVAISASEVGDDVAYHLAKNPAESRALAAQSQVNPMAAAEEFGRLEGRFLEAEPVMPSGPNINQLDIARYAGQMRGYLAKPAKETPRMTNAPEPPRHSVRGSGGRFDVGADTTDFAAFERKATAKR